MKRCRPYQSEAVEAVIKTWQRFNSCMLTMATGGGKTLTAAEISSKVKTAGRILFLANRNELCTQPLEVFAEQTGIIPGLEKAESYASLESQIVIGSVQTLCRKPRLERFPPNHFQFVFADEAHGAIAESWKRIFAHFKDAKLCGITATPFRADSKKLSDIFETEAYRKDLLSLVNDGYLVDPDHVDRLSVAISLADVRVKRTVEGIDYDLQDAADVIAPYFDEIAKELKTSHAHKHILAFLPLVASSQKFVEACRRHGLNAVHVDGEDPEREAKLEAFKAGQISLLSNSNLLHTGVDIPSCDCTLNLRPTRSKVLYCQIVGRSTRTVPGLIDNLQDRDVRLSAIAKSAKPKAWIIDPLWLTKDQNLCTPSFLVADNQELANEMQQKAGKSYSLRETLRQVQAEREGAIARRLEYVASFRTGKIHAEYFAASTHQHALVNYEPVYGWEARPLRPYHCGLLESRGIDPKSVTCEGHAWAVVKAINLRRAKRLPEIRELGTLAALGYPLEQLWNLKRDELRSLEWKMRRQLNKTS